MASRWSRCREFCVGNERSTDSQNYLISGLKNEVDVLDKTLTDVGIGSGDRIKILIVVRELDVSNRVLEKRLRRDYDNAVN